MAKRKPTSAPERRDLAQTAAGQIERICLSFMTQSEPDEASGSDPRPIPAAAVYELAARGRDLAIAIMDALGDDLVTTDAIQMVVRSPYGTFDIPRPRETQSSMTEHSD